MIIDDVLWAILGIGATLSVAYVRAELLTHRSYKELAHERFEREQLLWPSPHSAALKPDPDGKQPCSGGCHA